MTESSVTETSRFLYNISGILGFVDVSGVVYMAVITTASFLGELSTRQGVMQLKTVQFIALATSAYDDFLPDPYSGLSRSSIGDESEDSISQMFAQNASLAHPCDGLKRILDTGYFYFAETDTTGARWDISTRTIARLDRLAAHSNHPQDAGSGPEADAWDARDDRFVWNVNMAMPLLTWRDSLLDTYKVTFDQCQYLALVVQGYIGIVPLSDNSSLSIVSRLSWKRAGTRFNTRGIDDFGEVANFVETESILSTPNKTLVFSQIRGSIPLFWEQQGLQTFGHKLEITRSYAASHPAFLLHVQNLIRHYNRIHILHLLGTSSNEQALTDEYARHLNAACNDISENLSWNHMDFHAISKRYGSDGIEHALRSNASLTNALDQFGVTIFDQSGNIVNRQVGIIRSNCLDCLDRTNYMQELLSRIVLQNYINEMDISTGALWGAQRHLWAENGDALSKIYVGTGALNTSATRTGKRSLAGLISDATKSVGRAYMNLVLDPGKQNSIDLLLGNIADQRPISVFDPIQDKLMSIMQDRASEYSTATRTTIWVGTFNVCAQPPGADLSSWIHRAQEAKIMVFSLQEITQLMPQHIMKTDLALKRLWEAHLAKVLSSQGADWTLLRSEQLVGSCLIIFIKQELTSRIRKVEAITKKTGLGGMAGNKGAIAIRMDFDDTTLCFITAHFAAGHDATLERDADFQNISQTLRFARGHSVQSHDYVVWAGDFNYRIDLDNENVRQAIAYDKSGDLVHYDQLKQSQAQHQAFVDYQEAPITFAPTYKYDIGSGRYDTSEKLRIPAWTDRVLWKGDTMDCKQYYCAQNISMSDHRPVAAVLTAMIRNVQHAKKNQIMKEILSTLRANAPLNVSNACNSASEATRDQWWINDNHPEGVYAATGPEIQPGANPFAPDLTKRSAKPVTQPVDLLS